MRDNVIAGGNIMAGDGGYRETPLSEYLPDRYKHLSADELWFARHGHWLIRKKPNTKDDWFIVCGYPPANVLKIYGIGV